MLLTSNPKLSQVLLYFWSVMLIEEVITTIAQNDHQPPLVSQLDERPHKMTCTSSFFKFRGTLLKFSNCTYCYYAVSSQSYPNGQVEYDKQGW